MLHGGDLGGLQRSFGGPLGVLGVLWESRGVQGRPGKGWGDPREVPEGSWGALKNVIFFFFRGEFVNGLS